MVKRNARRKRGRLPTANLPDTVSCVESAVKDAGGNLKAGAYGILSFSVSAAPQTRQAPARE